MTLNIMPERRYAKCHYAECRGAVQHNDTQHNVIQHKNKKIVPLSVTTFSIEILDVFYAVSLC